MANGILGSLQTALSKLSAERTRVDRQIAALGTALGTLNGQVPGRRRQGRRRKMSAAARRAVGERMRAYWAKRRAARSAKPAKSARATRNPK